MRASERYPGRKWITKTKRHGTQRGDGRRRNAAWHDHHHRRRLRVRLRRRLRRRPGTNEAGRQSVAVFGTRSEGSALPGFETLRAQRRELHAALSLCLYCRVHRPIAEFADDTRRPLTPPRRFNLAARSISLLLCTFDRMQFPFLLLPGKTDKNVFETKRDGHGFVTWKSFAAVDS